MSLNYLKSEFYLKLSTEDWANQEKRTKQSFWPSDGLRPDCEIYWAWMNEPKTNPIDPNTLLMFKVASAYEHEVIKNLIAIGEAADIENEQVASDMGLNVIQREGDVPQIRLEMEREHVPITGYLDGISPAGNPIEVKSYGSRGLNGKFERGEPHSDHYFYQLAMQIDFLGATSGILASVCRDDGSIHFAELKRDSTDSLIFWVDDRTMSGVKPDYEPPELIVDLGEEYTRFRRIMENNILMHKEPALEYEYRPPITTDLLKQYPEEKIKKAIKGERVLSDHRWRYQYSSWKNKVIEKEMMAKGAQSVEELCRYTDEEIDLMMTYLNVEWKQTKAGPKLYKRKK